MNNNDDSPQDFIKDEMRAAAQQEELENQADQKGKQNDLGNKNGVISPASILDRFEVKESYVDKLGSESFLFDNLLINQHILTIIAESGGGKTTFFFFNVARELSRKGLTVWYIDADSPASDHKVMKKFADENNIKFIIPDVNEGTSVDAFVRDIKGIADSQEDLAGYILIFDTLKKFIDLMSKKSSKDFFVLMRKLTKLGASIVLLGHANKHRDSEGNLVFEGVGDIRSDSDDLIFFEKNKKSDDSMDVTTVVDSDKGAKVRGIFEPFSFNISPKREIIFHKKALKVVDLSNTRVANALDQDILEVAEQYLKSRNEPVKQSQLVEFTADKVEGQAGGGRVRKLIVKRSVKKGDNQSSGTRFMYEVGARNAHYYELIKEEPYQKKIAWGS